MFLSKKSLVRYAHSSFETFEKKFQTLCDGSGESDGHLTTLLGLAALAADELITRCRQSINKPLKNLPFSPARHDGPGC